MKLNIQRKRMFFDIFNELIFNFLGDFSEIYEKLLKDRGKCLKTFSMKRREDFILILFHRNLAAIYLLNLPH